MYFDLFDHRNMRPLDVLLASLTGVQEAWFYCSGIPKKLTFILAHNPKNTLGVSLLEF